MREILHRKKGFTLIELIISLSIVMVLSSFLVPNVKKQIDRAKKLKAINEGRQIYMSIVNGYIEDYDELSVDNLTENIKELTGIELSEGNIEIDDDVITVGYNVNKNDYSLKFNIEETGFAIKNGDDKDIFSTSAGNTKNDTNDKNKDNNDKTDG